MKTLLDLENWNRKEHFEHFNKMDEPFFGATVEIDCTKACQTAKNQKTSFFIFYLYKTLAAVNSIENFRYRISENKIYINDRIDASATIGRKDGSFGFSLMEYNPVFRIFEKNAYAEIDRIQNTTGLFTRSFDDDNLIHFSAIPWLNFTSLSHARSYSYPDSCPKISFGKMITLDNGKKTMPMSVHVHHGLMDGIHLGKFVDLFQELMNQ
ncbi:chloramphenicol acetyltransferase [Flavobacterium cheongpyeongense]|uniref:Chloramphenicol acetyltransferase n=1 Tax=Flavobacterium cheongpyeongense TaxID=2212651 RepID=A0A2V4BMS5_9FLAO|nr:chloramphenicol acetyltransferase [Flavobacterium cheongpyeongense]PXY40047.1 chloramphenicol acetyltransferase [Flavobacterium cheongpyeongense]